MFTWVKIAVRNLRKNARRSLFTMLAIALGFAAVSVFGGFTEYIFSGLQNAHIYAQANGHVVVFKKGYNEHGKKDPSLYLLTKEDVSDISDMVAGIPEVVLTTGQLQFSGLLSNGNISTIVFAIGRKPSDVAHIQKSGSDKLKKIQLYSGKSLQDDVDYGVGLSGGLAKILDLKIESNAILMAPTIDGQINALDVQVFNTFNTPIEALNDQLMVVPLSFAQSLYDTNQVNKIILLLSKTELTDTVVKTLNNTIEKHDLSYEVRPWSELAKFHSKVKKMFDVIFVFIFTIVLVIVVVSVVNTISMSVMERIREIGTLRALGVNRRGIISLFAVESALLGLFGSLFGCVITVACWGSVKIFEPMWTPPNITATVPLEVHLVPEYLFISFVFLVVLSLISAVLPVRKATTLGIVTALGHN